MVPGDRLDTRSAGMFKKLRAKWLLRSRSATQPADGASSFAVEDSVGPCAEFIAAMDGFENRCQPILELAEQAPAHAEAISETGKTDQAFLGRLEDALTEIRLAEVQIEETLETAGDLTPAAQARFETAADKIADVHSSVEAALQQIRMAKVDFDSLRDDDDDDDDFDGD